MKSIYMPNQMTQPRPSSALVAVQAAPSVQTSAQKQLQEKMMISDLQEKNVMMVAGEQRIVQHALEKNVLAMTTHFPLSVKLGSRGKANHLWTLLSLWFSVCPLCSVDRNYFTKRTKNPTLISFEAWVPWRIAEFWKKRLMFIRFITISTVFYLFLVNFPDWQT